MAKTTELTNKKFKFPEGYMKMVEDGLHEALVRGETSLQWKNNVAFVVRYRSVSTSLTSLDLENIIITL